MSSQTYLAVGVVSVLLTVTINPLLAAAGVLHFVLGSVLAVVAPLVFGVIAVGVGIQLYRDDEHRQGVGLIGATVICVLVGIALGVSPVF